MLKAEMGLGDYKTTDHGTTDLGPQDCWGNAEKAELGGARCVKRQT